MFFYLAKVAVVSAAAVHTDCAAHRLWLDPDLDGLGAMGTALRHRRRDPSAGRGPVAARQRADPAARESLPARQSRSAAAANGFHRARRRRGQAGRAARQRADAERGRRADRGDRRCSPSKFPEAKIAFSGGDAGVLYKSSSEATGAAALLTDVGVAREQLILEADARDTYENAVYLKAELDKLGLLGPGKRWVLITSAYHMPRAMASFRAGRLRCRALAGRLPDAGTRRSHAALRQGLGRLAPGRCRHARMGRAARLSACGRSDALLPAPRCRRRSGCDLSTPARAGKARQHPHVDPILEIGRGSELGARLRRRRSPPSRTAR